MKITIIILVLFHSVLLTDQEPVPPKYNIHSGTLCIGDNLDFGNKSIKFKKVISDSRCPNVAGVTCVWAGEVEVLVEFYEDGRVQGEKIITGTNIEIGEYEIVSAVGISITEFFNEKGLDITSVEVTPYPGKEKISPEEYSVSLSIARKETD